MKDGTGIHDFALFSKQCFLNEAGNHDNLKATSSNHFVEKK